MMTTLIIVRLSFLLIVLMTTALSPVHAIAQLSDEYLSAWKITKATTSDNLAVTLGSGGQLAMSRLDSDSSSDYRLSIKVANRFTTSIHVLEEGDNGGFKIEVNSGIATTRMMPPPELRELERFLSESLRQFDTLRLLEEGNSVLELSSAENGASLVCEKIDGIEGST
jgi:hypothetical protein